MHTTEVTQFGRYSFIKTGIAVMLLHNEDGGPALEYMSGHTVWYKEGRRHRLDGPAVMYSDGRMKWYVDGYLHNEHGPAATWPSGAMVYAIKGKFHNVNGPAIVTREGTCYWFVKGARLTKEQFDEKYPVAG